MQFLNVIRYQMRRAMWPVVVFTILFYFGYHAVEGDNGLLALRGLNQELTVIEEQLAAVRAEKAILERRTSDLRPDNIDPDLLDERARAALGFIRKDDIVILLHE